VLLRDGSSKTLQKTVYKKIVPKSVYKKIDKKSKTDFFSNFFYHVFGRFSVSSKTRLKKLIKKCDQPWYFFGLRGTNQPPQGPSKNILSAP
jgi:hypothetical protein